MRMTIYDIYAIDPVTQTFNAEFGLHMSWHSPELITFSEHLQEDYFELDMTELTTHQTLKDKIIVPNIYLEGCIESRDINHGFINVRKKDVPGTVRWEKRMQGKFKQIFDLVKFPYDVHTLRIRLRLNNYIDNKVLKRYFVVGSDENEDATKIKPNVQVPEWRLYAPSHNCLRDDKDKPLYEVYITINRRHGYYTKNVIVMMGCMCTLCLGSFVVDHTEYADRTSIVLTLLLTVIAFKFVVGEALPKIPYLTLLDIYMNTAVAFLLVVFILQTIILGTIANDDETLKDMDRVCFYISAVSWGTVNTYYVVTIATYLRQVRLLLGDEINVNAHESDAVVSDSSGCVTTRHKAQKVGMGFLISERDFHTS